LILLISAVTFFIVIIIFFINITGKSVILLTILWNLFFAAWITTSCFIAFRSVAVWTIWALAITVALILAVFMCYFLFNFWSWLPYYTIRDFAHSFIDTSRALNPTRRSQNRIFFCIFSQESQLVKILRRIIYSILITLLIPDDIQSSLFFVFPLLIVFGWWNLVLVVWM